MKSPSLVFLGHFDWKVGFMQFHRELMEVFVQRGWTVLWVGGAIQLRQEPHRWLTRPFQGELERKNGVWCFRPWSLPGARFGERFPFPHRLMAKQVRKVLSTLGMEQPAALVFTPLELPLLSRLPHSISTYWTGDECVLPGERDLMEYVDRIAAISPSVFEEKFRLFPSKVFRTSTGVAFDRYHRAVRCSSLPDEFRGLKRPIVGYAGIINSSRLDFALIEALVSKRRDWTFVFVGPEDEAARARMSRLASPNVRMLGPKPYEEAAGYMRAFDVAIIPYARTRFNLGCNPLKLYEYLAVGRSVVSTDLPSVRESGDVVRVACDAEEFERCIQAALEEQVTAETLERRYAVAREHSAERVAVALEPVLSGFSTSVGSVCR